MGEHFRRGGPEQGPQKGGTAGRRDDDSMLDLDTVHAVLDHPRRRIVLEVITETDFVTTRDLAAQIAARENEVPPDELTDDQRRSVTIALYHVHLPKLVDAGVVTVEQGMDRIRPGPNVEQTRAALGGLYEGFGDDGEQQRVDASK